MDCSLKLFISELCHKPDYQPFSKEVFQIYDLRDCEQLLLKLRISKQIETTCQCHKNKYLTKSHPISGINSSDSLQIYKKTYQKSFKRNPL